MGREGARVPPRENSINAARDGPAQGPAPTTRFFCQLPIWIENCYFAGVGNFLIKLLKVKKRNEIRSGKLWEVTRAFGVDLMEVELEPVKPEAFKKPEAMPINQ